MVHHSRTSSSGTETTHNKSMGITKIILHDDTKTHSAGIASCNLPIWCSHVRNPTGDIYYLNPDPVASDGRSTHKTNQRRLDLCYHLHKETHFDPTIPPLAARHLFLRSIYCIRSGTRSHPPTICKTPQTNRDLYFYNINMNSAVAAGGHLVRKVYTSLINGTAKSSHAYLIQSRNWISTFTFQICHPNTGTGSNPQPICVDIPWWYLALDLLAVCTLITAFALLLVTPWLLRKLCGWLAAVLLRGRDFLWVKLLDGLRWCLKVYLCFYVLHYFT